MSRRAGLLTMRFLIAVVLNHFMVTWLPCFCRNEQLYRLIDQNLGCDPNSRIVSFTAYSLSTCASACKLDSSCGMFSMNNVVAEKETRTTPKGSVSQKCELCKSANMSSTMERDGWSIYMKWMKDAKFHVLETDNRSSQPNLPPLELWNIDCNRPEITDHKNGVIIGIWDDKDSFRDLDKVKCLIWGEGDLFSEKPSRLLHIHLEDYRQCPRNYVLTAITASNAAFRNVDKGKCSPLAAEFEIDYEHCVTVTSEGQDGGSADKWRPWRVQCPTLGPQVAVSLHRRRRIHTGLKCCVLKGLLKD